MAKIALTAMLACILALYGVPATGLAYAQEAAAGTQATEQVPAAESDGSTEVGSQEPATVIVVTEQAAAAPEATGTETPAVESEEPVPEPAATETAAPEAPVVDEQVAPTEEATSQVESAEPAADEPEALTLTAQAVEGEAEEAASPEYEVNGSKTADPTELGDDRKTTITLSLPSAEYQNKIDIVFVMDDSNSKWNSELHFEENVEELLDAVIAFNPNLDIKVGIVKFKGTAKDAIAGVTNNELSGLTQYSKLIKDKLQEAINVKTDVLNPGSRGTNLHDGLVLANKWLEADTEVEDANKYVVALTDGKSYIWNDENNNPTSFYTQWYKQRTVKKGSSKPVLTQQGGANDKSVPSYAFDANNRFWFDTYAELYASDSEELSSASAFDQYCWYAINGTTPTGSVVKHVTTNGSQVAKGDYPYYFEFTPDDEWSDMVWLELNPYAVVKNDDESYSFDLDTPNPNFYQYHPDSLQKGLYKAGHVWSELNSKYNCGSVVFTDYKGTGLELAQSFCNWMRENSNYSANVSSVSDVAELFKGISNSINYLIGKGTVTDPITDEFDLDESDAASTFSIKVGGDVVTLSSNSGSEWFFGEAIDGVHPYVVHYDSANKTITWDINVPVENARHAALSYGLILKEGMPTGDYKTNKETFLDYTSTDGKYTGTFTFPIPTVKWVVPDPDPTPTPDPEPEPTPDPDPDPTPTPTPDPDPTTDDGTVNPVPANVPAVTPAPVPVTPAAIVPVAPAAPAAPAPAAIADDATPLAQPATDAIDDDATPLAALGAWSLFDLLCTILTAIVCIVLLVRAIGRSKRDAEEDEQRNVAMASEDENENEVEIKRHRALRIASLVPAIAAIVLFVLTQDLTQPMVIFDSWSIVFAIIAIVQLVVAFLARKKEEDPEDEDREQQGYVPAAAAA